MQKPQAPQKAIEKSPEKYSGPPARRVRAIRTGNNQYDIVEETFAGPPTSVKVLKAGSPRIPAEDRVRLWHEEFIGFNRFGDSGL